MFARRLLILGLVTVGALAAPTAAVAATPLSVVVLSGSQCVFGTAPKKTEVVMTLRTPSGHLRGRAFAQSNKHGDWFACFSVSGINGGDSLRLMAGSQDRTLVVPRVGPRVDRVQNTIEGTVAPNTQVAAQVVHNKTLKKSVTYEFNVMSDSSGHYSFDTTGTFNLRGGDSVTVATPSGNDIFGAMVVTPFMNVVYANNLVIGTANNGTDLVLELRDSHGALKADVTAGSFPLILGISLFEVGLFDDDGSAVYPIGGDQLSATLASDATLVMPSSSLSANAHTDVVTGRCMPNAYFALSAGLAVFYGKTDATGRVTRDASTQTDLVRGDGLSLSCLYPTGDVWSRGGSVL